MTSPQPPFPPPPPQHPDRSGFLIAFGVVETLIGIFFLLIIAMIGAMRGMIAGAPNAKELPPNFMLSIVVIYGGLAAVFFAMAVGSFMRRNWGRILCLIISWMWLAFGALGVLMSAVIMPQVMRDMPQTPNAPPVNTGAVVAVMVTMMMIFMVALPLVFVLFYSRPSVKATCLRMSGGQASDFPAILGLLMVWYGFTALSTVFILARPRGSMVLGFVIGPIAAKIYAIAVIAVCVYLIYAFYKREPMGWKVAVGFAVFSFLSIVSAFYAGDTMAKYRQMGMTEAELASMTRTPMMMSMIKIFTLVLGAVHLILLVYARRYFGNSVEPVLPTVEVPPPPPAPPTELGPAM